MYIMRIQKKVKLTEEEKKKKKLKSWLIYKIRRVSMYWPEKKEVYHRIKKAPGEYQCEKCKNIFKQKDIQIDHINPVIDVTSGFTNWDDFITRLFCSAENLQGLCIECHKSKSSEEMKIRVANRKLKKD